jgi:hypothetical protein
MGRIEKIKRELIEEANKRILGEYFKEEPVIDIEVSPLECYFLFKEGNGSEPFMSYNSDNNSWSDGPNENEIIDAIAAKIDPTLDIINDYKGGEFDDQLKDIIQISSQSSSSGGDAANANVGQQRLDYVEDLVFKALDKTGVKDTFAKKALTSYTDTTYDPSRLPPHRDGKKVDPMMAEQMARIKIIPRTVKGSDNDKITRIKLQIDSASGNFSTDEDKIVDAIKQLGTYSDITELDKRFPAGLQAKLNSQITDGWTGWGSDRGARNSIMTHLNAIAKDSNKTKIAVTSDDKLVIILDQ